MCFPFYNSRISKIIAITVLTVDYIFFTALCDRKKSLLYKNIIIQKGERSICKAFYRHSILIYQLFFLSFSHEDALSGDHCNDGECLNFVARLSFADEERPLHSVASVKVRWRILYSLFAAKHPTEFSRKSRIF